MPILTFELITADPIHPWMKGAAALYTKDGQGYDLVLAATNGVPRIDVDGLTGWREGSEINRDRNRRLMFLAGLYLNRYQQSTIYGEILWQSAFPCDIFFGSPQTLLILRMLLGFE